MSSKKALIVDDSRLAQFVLKKMLIAQKMDVDTSESAEEALGYLKQHKPDVIFLDHSMPGMNGLEALKIIKDNPHTAPIPVMMYTSQEDSAYMVQAKSLGAVDVLPKQLTTADLQQVLNKLELDKKDVARITTAANEANPQQTPATKQEPPLEVLVKDAESALHHEAIEQQFQRKLKQQQDSFEQELAALHEKINNLIPAAESNSNRQNFWNNILWAAIYCITVIGFVVVYFQQKTTIEQLSTRQPVAQNIIREAPQQPPADAIVTTPESLSSNNQPQPADNSDQLASLENLLNSNNQIPMDELLLGETILTSVNELIPALTQLNFSGRVSILAHDGNFCLNTGSSGQFELATDDLPVTQCQISEASDRLADIASINLLRTVTASNQTAGRQFVITFEPQGSNQPLDDYPAISDEITAGEWNAIALRNRRVEFELIPAR